MADENKGIRLKKAATELNVGISTLVEFLAKKGHQVEMNPNTRLSTEQYDLVASAFQGERAVKEQADKIEITPSGSNVVIEANADEKKDETDEVIIKNYNTSAIDNKGTQQPAESAATPDEPAEPTPAEPEPAPVEEPQPVAEEPAKVEEEPVAIEEEAPAPAETDAAPVEETASAPTPTPTQVGDLRIISKIDLDAINSKMRPDKKKKTKAEKGASKGSKKAAETPAEPKAKPAPKPVEEIKPAVPEQPAEPQPAPAPAPAKPEPEFIETQYTKLEGPKLVGMVDLSQFEKPKPSSEKKKRKRIKNKGVKVSDTNGEPERSATPAPSKNTAKERKADTDAKSEKSERKEKKKKKEKKPVKVEIDETEIEKQVRDTLARLSPMGKSKTSKHNREKRQKVHQRI